METNGYLLVDDDPAFRAAARALLGADGIVVTSEAATGREALRAAAHDRPAVVLLDVQLPDIDGFEVARRLCARATPPAVVLISTRDAIDYGRAIRDCGAIGFITKARFSGVTLRAILRGDVEG